jgi:hypothetical protein
MPSIRFAILGVLVALLMMSCTSIRRQDTFTPCAKANCQTCQGRGDSRCTRCLGRGSSQCQSCKGSGFVRMGAINKPCGNCSGGMSQCTVCNGNGMMPCGTTKTHWYCNKCGKTFTYAAANCPTCEPAK